MSESQKRITASDILNRCTGIMKLDENGDYVGYYTRGEMELELLAQGHDKMSVGMYMIGLRDCTEMHPKVVKK